MVGEPVEPPYYVLHVRPHRSRLAQKLEELRPLVRGLWWLLLEGPARVPEHLKVLQLKRMRLLFLE